MWLCRGALVTEVRRKLRACCKSHKPDCTSWAFANALPKKVKEVNAKHRQAGNSTQTCVVFFLHFSSPRRQNPLSFGEQSRTLTGGIRLYTTSEESQKEPTH